MGDASTVLLQALNGALSQNGPDRKNAESWLSTNNTQPGFLTLLLSLLTRSDIPLPVRQMGAVFLKNTVKKHWKNEAAPIAEQDKTQIRAVIVDLMLSLAGDPVQKNISATLEVISDFDFPWEWQDLLKILVSKFNTTDFKVINGVLRTCRAIFKKYRHQVKSDETLRELKYILDNFAQPYINLFYAVDKFATEHASNPAAAVLLFTSLKYLLNIYYSLSYVDLPEKFEDNLRDMMTLFRKYLNMQTSMKELVEADKDDKPGLLTQMQASICQILDLYIGKYEEEFTEYLDTFVKDVWGLLTRIGKDAKYDNLSTYATAFLATVSQSVHYKLFSDPSTLQLVIEKIVIPNLQLREYDEEMFEDDAVEYIRRDIEGSDSDTRRRAATELVKGLRKFFEKETTSICGGYITKMLNDYASNPKGNWRHKDVSIYLLTALAVRGSTAASGTTNVNQMVPIMDFFASSILPELQSPSSPHLILKADALKFITTFRQQIPPPAFVQLVPIIIQNMTTSSQVVATYCANAIDKFLLVKDNGNLRFGRTELQPLLDALIGKLFSFMESSENEYMMKALLRVVMTAKEDIVPYSGQITMNLVKILERIVRNPTNPTFNHYLFETISSTITSIASKNPQHIAAYENLLFGPFTAILEMDASATGSTPNVEFSPYVFQILSLLLERTPSTVNDAYMKILPPLLSPTLWERAANIPALTRLIQAYISKGRDQITAGGHIVSILGVFKKLIASKTYDGEGFEILESIVLHLSPEAFSQYMQTVFQLIFTRLTSPKDKTVKFVKGFLVFFSLFVSKHGGTFVMNCINQVQNGIFMNVLGLAIADIAKINGKIERKMSVIAMTNLICNSPAMMEAPYKDTIPHLFALCTAQIEGRPEESNGADTGSEGEEEEVTGFTTFSKLAQATKQDQDPFPEVTDPKLYFVSNLKQASTQRPGFFLPIVQTMPEAPRNLLLSYFKACNIPEPYIL